MPSPIGHGLAGLAVGLALEPSDHAKAAWTGRLVSTFAAVAAITSALPDIDLLYPPVHRGATHSLGANVLLMIIAAGVTRWVTGRIAWRWVAMLGFAHSTHLLLDWLGTDRYHPTGLQALWPFSERFYISGWDLFPPTERRVWLPQAVGINLRALMVEIAYGAPAAALGWLLARRRRKNRGPTSFPGGLPRPFASAADTAGTSDHRGRRAEHSGSPDRYPGR